MEVGKVIVVLKDLFEFGLYDREVVLSLYGNREDVGIEVPLITDQGVFMEWFTKKVFDKQRTYF